MAVEPTRKASLPPRWFIRLFWSAHRALTRISGGRLGLGRATDDKWGTMRVHTVGRRSGAERAVMLGYFEDGPNLVTMAMNGWADPEPAWWLNLQAQPDVTVDIAGKSGRYHAHAADTDERPRLWARWAHYDKDLEAYAARRSRETAVVIFEPIA
jgi:deazaflavin-dependent oxidoreductase (nitroreductase family)